MKRFLEHRRALAAPAEAVRICCNELAMNATQAVMGHRRPKMMNEVKAVAVWMNEQPVQRTHVRHGRGKDAGRAEVHVLARLADEPDNGKNRYEGNQKEEQPRHNRPPHTAKNGEWGDKKGDVPRQTEDERRRV